MITHVSRASRARLCMAIAAALAAPSMPVAARTLLPGADVTVRPGDVVEAWMLNQATLTVLTGASTNAIEGFQSTLNLSGQVSDTGSGVLLHNGSTATLTGAQVTSLSATGLVLSNQSINPGSDVGATATVARSQITGGAWGGVGVQCRYAEPRCLERRRCRYVG